MAWSQVKTEATMWYIIRSRTAQKFRIVNWVSTTSCSSSSKSQGIQMNIRYHDSSPDTFLTKNPNTGSNSVIRGTVLIGDWFSAETNEVGQFDPQSPLFHISKVFSWKTLFFCSKMILNALKYYWVKMSLSLTIKKLSFTFIFLLHMSIDAFKGWALFYFVVQLMISRGASPLLNELIVFLGWSPNIYELISKLWNQVLSLDHLVIQHSGNFLCWKYR